MSGILVLLWSVPAMAQDNHFRHSIWGATKEDVRKFETALFYKEEGDAVLFMDKPDTFRRLITYDFKNGKLWRGREEYRELHDPEPQKILDLYGERELSLQKELGKPTREEFIWKNGRYKFHPKFWGSALRDGDLMVRAIWEYGDTRMTLETYNDGMFYQVTKRAEQISVADVEKEPSILLMPGSSE